MTNFQVLMVLGYFISVFIIFQQFKDLDMSKFELFKLLVLLLSLSFLIPIKLYRKALTMSMYEYVIFNFIGFTTISCALVFTLNYTFKGEVYTESHKIEKIIRLDKGFLFQLEDETYADREFLRTMNDNEDFKREGNEYLNLTFSDGLFGIRIIEGRGLH